MKSNAPWSVKGIERDARETAKEAARREGMTVGEWLSQIIYSAGDPDTDQPPSRGAIEGLQAQDLVAAIEHLSRRVTSAETKSASAVDELARTFGGVVERVQRLERVRSSEVGGTGASAELVERIEALESKSGDRQRIETLKALERAVAQVAVQFDATQRASLNRMDGIEERLQDLAVRLESSASSQDDGSASAIAFLKDAVEGMAARIGRAERIASEASRIHDEAARSIDPEFVERTGVRIRILGDEIKRGGDQIRALETTMSRLAEQIDAAERRSAGGVEKVAETLAELRAQIEKSEPPVTRGDIDAALADAHRRTEERIARLQKSLDALVDRIDRPVGPGDLYRSDPAAPAATLDGHPDESGRSEGGAPNEKSGSGHRVPGGSAAPGDYARLAALDDDIDDAIDLDRDLEGDVGETTAKKRAINFSSSQATIQDSSIFDEEFTFDLDGDHSDELSEPLETRPIDRSGSSKNQEHRGDEEGELHSSLFELEQPVSGDYRSDRDDEHPDEAPGPFGRRPVPSSRGFAENELAGTALADDFLKSARRLARDAANAGAEPSEPGKRRLSPRQKAILAARLRRQRAAAEAKADESETSQPNEDIAEETKPATPQKPTVAPSSGLGLLGVAFDRARAGVRALGKREPASERAAEDPGSDAESEDSAGFLLPGRLLKSRTVAAALVVAIVLAGAALFFLLNDAVRNEGAPRPTPPLAEAARASPQPAVPPAEAPVLNPRDLFAASMQAYQSAATIADEQKALQGITEAATLGHPPAQLQMGEFYKVGQGFAQDPAEARRWYERAANGGNILAMHRLGVMLARGEGGPPDLKASVALFEQASNLGLVDSQYNLGATFHPTANGADSGVQNREKSFFWYSLAARNGDSQAGALAAGVGASLDAATRQEIEQQVLSWSALPADPVANEPPPTF